MWGLHMIQYLYKPSVVNKYFLLASDLSKLDTSRKLYDVMSDGCIAGCCLSVSEILINWLPRDLLVFVNLVNLFHNWRFSAATINMWSDSWDFCFVSSSIFSYGKIALLHHYIYEYYKLQMQNISGIFFKIIFSFHIYLFLAILQFSHDFIVSLNMRKKPSDILCILLGKKKFKLILCFTKHNKVAILTYTIFKSYL